MPTPPPFSPANPPARRRPPQRRSRLLAFRALPLLAVAVVAFGVGVVAGARHETPDRRIASRFVAAWARGDYAAMHELLAPARRDAVKPRRFLKAYRDAAAVATLRAVEPAGRLVEVADREFDVPMLAHTRIFGDLRGPLHVTVTGEAEQAGVEWSRTMVFPGLRSGERLTRSITLPPRGRLEARDGTVLAQGPDRASD